MHTLPSVNIYISVFWFLNIYNEQIIIISQLGMDGFFFFRIDYGDHQKRLQEKTMEMVWRGSKSLGTQTEIFTGVLFEGYGPPEGFCFDIQCKSVEPIQV